MQQAIDNITLTHDPRHIARINSFIPKAEAYADSMIPDSKKAPELWSMHYHARMNMLTGAAGLRIGLRQFMAKIRTRGGRGNVS